MLEEQQGSAGDLAEPQKRQRAVRQAVRLLRIAPLAPPQQHLMQLARKWIVDSLLVIVP